MWLMKYLLMPHYLRLSCLSEYSYIKGLLYESY